MVENVRHWKKNGVPQIEFVSAEDYLFGQGLAGPAAAQDPSTWPAITALGQGVLRVFGRRGARPQGAAQYLDHAGRSRKKSSTSSRPTT